MTKKILKSTVALAMVIMYVVTLAVSFYLIREADILLFKGLFDNVKEKSMTICLEAENAYGSNSGLDVLKNELSQLLMSESDYPLQYVLIDSTGNVVCKSDSTLFGEFFTGEHEGELFNIDIQRYITDENREILQELFSGGESSKVMVNSMNYCESPNGAITPISITYKSRTPSAKADYIGRIDFCSMYPIDGSITNDLSGKCDLLLLDTAAYSYKSMCYANLNYRLETAYKELIESDALSYMRATPEGVSSISNSYDTYDEEYCMQRTDVDLDGKPHALFIGMLRNDMYSLLYSNYTLPVFIAITGLFIVLGVGLGIIVVMLFNKSKMLNETRVAFISGAAHELKTPLAVIRNQCECIMENVAPEKNEYYISSIYGEAGRMNDDVMRLLQYSRLSAVKKLVKFDFNVSELITSEIEKQSVLAQSKQILLTSTVDSDIHAVCAGDLIALAAGNYISNAIKYAPKKGEVKVSLSLHSSKCMLTVYNDGEKIAASEKKKIWDILYKSDSARTSNGSSTGIGLPTNKLIFKLHKYKYGFKNVSDGVCFWFEISKAKKGANA